MQRMPFLTLEQFRQIREDDFGRDPNSKLVVAWMPGLEVSDTENYRPHTKEGRLFQSFYRTFSYTLGWYKLHKIGRFNPYGWTIDKSVVESVKQKFDQLIKTALSQSKGDPGIDAFLKGYDAYILSFYTAIDHRFQNITGTEFKNVLDFGSGIGRQSFIWQNPKSSNFFSVDAIESLYILQNHIYIYIYIYEDQLVEYFNNPEGFRHTDFQSSTGKLYHLPTWKLDLIPDRFLDLIIAVQVLQEGDEVTLAYILAQFKRTIKVGGLLYIRDDEWWTPEHKVRVGRELLRNGWRLTFKYPTEHADLDIEGIPRLWVY